MQVVDGVLASPVSEGKPAICRAISDAIDQAGITEQELADRLRVRQSSVWKWRTKREPRLDRIVAIEDALGLGRGELLRRAGYVKDRPTRRQRP